MHQPHVGIRTEIQRSVTNQVPGRKNPGEGFIFNTNPRVGLVIFESYIIPRTVLFNQVVFQQQGILFCIYYDIPDVGDFSHEHLEFAADGVNFGEIGTNPLFEILRFPYVDDPVPVIEELIHPGLVWQGLYDAIEVGEVE